MAACYFGYYTIVKLLVKRGAKPNLTDNNGVSALIVGSLGRYKISQLLLINGADVNLQDHTGVSALHRATVLGNIRVVELLLKAGALTDIVSQDTHHP